MSRLDACFSRLRAEGRAGLVAFATAGDPNPELSEEILLALPQAGADVLELGMPFTDPMADGPSIERAGGRALAAGQTMARTLAMVSALRRTNDEVPVVLMGYFNPVLAYGPDRFSRDAADAGVDGVIVVDLPPEEEAELAAPARAAGVDVVRLVAPTSTDARMDALLERASGFVYYVSVRGITGTRTADMAEVARNVARIRARTDLPVAVGFGIRTPGQAAEIARLADAAVVGSAIVEKIENGLDDGGRPAGDVAAAVTGFVADLARAVRRARDGTAA